MESKVSRTPPVLKGDRIISYLYDNQMGLRGTVTKIEYDEVYITFDDDGEDSYNYDYYLGLIRDGYFLLVNRYV